MGERSLLRRMFRAITLEADFYEEVEAEHASIRQATLIVLLVSLAGGLGTALRDVILGSEAPWWPPSGWSWTWSSRSCCG